eukprot:Selendium_serpulae@DN6015_c0_g1_i1.p1
MNEDAKLENEKSDAPRTKKVKADSKSSVVIVTPGQRLGRVEQYTIGDGTYVVRNYIYASVLGQAHIDNSTDGQLPTLSIRTLSGVPSAPRMSSTIIARVLRVQSRVCHCQILFTNVTSNPAAIVDEISRGVHSVNYRVTHSYKAQIRLQDVRQYEVDKVNMLNCFRPNDILRAKVISVGTGVFLLSTAPLDMGVVIAESAAGGALEPISCKWMRCAVSGLLEPRKVARPPMLADKSQSIA